MAETIKPTTHNIEEGLVDNPANGFDGNLNTIALLRVPVPGDRTVEDLGGFPNGAITPSMRQTVLLRIPGRHESNDNADRVFIGLSIDAGASFAEINSSHPPIGWPVIPNAVAWREFDITAIVGSTPFSQVVVRRQMSNGSATVPPPDFKS